MKRPEPWELSDEQFWGEINHAALVEAFRRSEVSEAREARQAWAAAHPEIIAQRWAEVIFGSMLAMGRALDGLMTWECAPPTPPQPVSTDGSRRPQHLPPVPSLRVALAANVRPRPGPCRRQRTPHAQRS